MSSSRVALPRSQVSPRAGRKILRTNDDDLVARRMGNIVRSTSTPRSCITAESSKLVLFPSAVRLLQSNFCSSGFSSEFADPSRVPSVTRSQLYGFFFFFFFARIIRALLVTQGRLSTITCLPQSKAEIALIMLVRDSEPPIILHKQSLALAFRRKLGPWRTEGRGGESIHPTGLASAPSKTRNPSQSRGLR